jgi:hypothetical protein
MATITDITENYKKIKNALREYPYGVYVRFTDKTRHRIINVTKKGKFRFDIKTIYGDIVKITCENLDLLDSMDNGAHHRDELFGRAQR